LQGIYDPQTNNCGCDSTTTFVSSSSKIFYCQCDPTFRLNPNFPSGDTCVCIINHIVNPYNSSICIPCNHPIIHGTTMDSSTGTCKCNPPATLN